MNYLHIFLGIIDSAIFISMFTNLYNFFDLQKDIPDGQPLLWLFWFVAPPLIISVMDKLRVVFFPKEHEDVFKDQLMNPVTLLAETVAWAIPNMLGGLLWCFFISVLLGLFYWLTGDALIMMFTDRMGLIVQSIK